MKFLIPVKNFNTLALIFISVSFFSVNANADWPKTEMDFMLLPPFCAARHANGGSLYHLWEKKLGPDFLHTHHFCGALHQLRLAQNVIPLNSEKKQYRRYLLGEAISNIEYMENKASPKYALFPFIYTTKAEVFIEMNKNQEAIIYLKKAMEANNKYPKSYLVLSQLYSDMGERSLAIKTLEDGIKELPNSKILHKRLLKLKK